MEHPTIRDLLRKRKRRALIAIIGAWLVAVTSMISFEARGGAPNPLMMLVPMALFMGAMLYLLFFVRCPRCKGNLGLLNATFSKATPRLSPINFCPYCGVSLDTRAGS